MSTSGVDGNTYFSYTGLKSTSFHVKEDGAYNQN